MIRSSSSSSESVYDTGWFGLQCASTLKQPIVGCSPISLLSSLHFTSYSFNCFVSSLMLSSELFCGATSSSWFSAILSSSESDKAPPSIDEIWSRGIFSWMSIYRKLKQWTILNNKKQTHINQIHNFRSTNCAVVKVLITSWAENMTRIADFFLHLIIKITFNAFTDGAKHDKVLKRNIFFHL